VRRWLVFPYFNEAEVVEIKLGELGHWADVIVVAEGNRTYAGEEREYQFDKEKRWHPWHDKIRYLPVDLPLFPGIEGIQPSQAFQQANNGAWMREEYLRNAPSALMNDLMPQDIVLLTDADEIPSLKTVEMYEKNLIATEERPSDQVIRFNLPQHLLYLNWRWTWEPQAVARLATGYQVLRRGIHDVVRDDATPLAGVTDGGWHFSYMGGRERVIHKITQAAHIELARYGTWDNVGRCFVTGEDLFGRGEDYQLVSVPFETLPSYVKSYRNHFDWMLGEELVPA
jgi:beta-1,4-mannosyl-glycoprotein beta-1,4-N-acetylglucosaminyltransferase